jgi:hypothetical protein
MSGFGFSGFGIDDLQPALHQFLPFGISQPAHAGPILFNDLHAGRLFSRIAGRRCVALVLFHAFKFPQGVENVNAIIGG